mmetsp:Transcript_2207/g.2539  ORF Transcript_2207/g.2539 Transcript_2207/m.2539 type:complete len:450 (+) Transcript_2207:75-1424(+)
MLASKALFVYVTPIKALSILSNAASPGRKRNRSLGVALCSRFLSSSFSNIKKENGIYKFRENRIVKFDHSLVYKVVADVDAYEKFLPWVRSSNVTNYITPLEFTANLDIGFQLFSEKYLSRVYLSHDVEKLLWDDGYKVEAYAEGSPLFDELGTVWRLKNVSGKIQECDLSVSVDFKFKSQLYEAAADMFIASVVDRMVDAFLNRCTQIVSAKDETYLSKLPMPAFETSSEPLAAMKTSSSDMLTLLELESLSHFSRLELKHVKDRFDQALKKQGERGSTTLTRMAFVNLFLDLFYCSPTYLDLIDTSLKTVSRKVLLAIAEHQFDALDVNNDGVIDLREFVAGMSIILKGTATEKCRLWFRCYDHDQDGLVSKQELESMLKATLAVRTALLIAIKTNSGKVMKPKELTSHLLSVNAAAVADILQQNFGEISSDKRFSLKEIMILKYCF